MHKHLRTFLRGAGRHVRECLTVTGARKRVTREIPDFGPWAVVINGIAYGRIALYKDALRVAEELDGEVVLFRPLHALAEILYPE